MADQYADSPARQSTSSLTPNRSGKFISVLLPKSVLSNTQDRNSSVEELVFTDQAKAINVLKQNKGSRMLIFDNYEDALNCSLEGISDAEPNREPSKEKVAANFPSPTPPELSVLRRAIEKGELDLVRAKVSSNPKYLITSSDTPVILMEGPRYNAVHIASKFNQVKILDFILKTINNPSFIKTLYPNDSDEVTEETRKHLLDLYLNTPDKAALDTPLHFACKFAASDCVKLLLSHPDCDRGRLNKLNETAYKVICSRKNDDKAKKKIKDHFEARYYVAINRELDRVIVCKPSEVPPKSTNISGIAGPMSPNLAEEIYNTLKSPAKSSSPRTFRIRFTDGSRGVERVARMECRRYNLNWIEFWPFLGCYVDLSSPQGLSMLEKHLRNVYIDLTSKRPDEEESSPSILSDREGDQSTISYLCDRLGSLALISHQEIQLPFEDEEGIKEESQQKEEEPHDDHHSVHTISDGDSDDSYATPPSSPVILDYYVNGKQLTQNDRDAANALSEVQIDPYRYPYIFQWLRKVKLKQQSIPSPFKEIRESSFSKEPLNFAQFESTPRTRKSINLIDLITPRRYSFNDDQFREAEEDDDDDDNFEDSRCHFDVDDSDDDTTKSSREKNKENIRLSSSSSIDHNPLKVKSLPSKR